MLTPRLRPCLPSPAWQSFAKLSDSIFFGAADGSAFYVNLFVSSVAKWAAKPGVTIEQRAYFPSDPKLTGSITVRVKAPPARNGTSSTSGAPLATARSLTAAATSRFSLKIRVPAWLKRPGSAHINGQPAGDMSPLSHLVSCEGAAWRARAQLSATAARDDTSRASSTS